jgi:abortive infection bacteriophage resistance protein
MPSMPLPRKRQAQIGGLFFFMKYTKPFLTYEQQLDQLIARGLLVADKAAGIRTLRAIGYYRLSAYALPFQRIKDKFNDGVRLEDILDLYYFDHDLRFLTLDVLEIVEVSMRTAIAHHLGREYGPFGYTEAVNFAHGFHHSQWLAGVEEEIGRSSETFVHHYRAKYSDSPHFPIWIACEILSFGALSRLYSGLKFHDQKKIAQQFSIPAPVLHSWLHCLTYVRNLCAHHARLWNRELAITPRFPENNAEWKTPYQVPNHRIFGILSILQYCLGKLGAGRDLRMGLNTLLHKYPAVDQRAMGIQADWLDHSIWA